MLSLEVVALEATKCAGPGEGFKRVFDSASEGNVLAIAFLVVSVLVYTALVGKAFKPLFRPAGTLEKQFWRTVAWLSLCALVASSVVFWIWIKESIFVFFLPLIFLVPLTVSLKKCK